MKNTVLASPSERKALDAAIAALSAPQHPAEAQAQGDRMAIKMLVAAGYVTEAKANEALKIAHGFDKGPLAQAQGGGEVVAWEARDPDDGTRWLTRHQRVRDGWRGLGRTIRPLVYGDAAPPSAPVGVEGLREIYSAVIRALAAIVTTGGSDKIEKLGAIPRSPVMDQVAAIRWQMDKLSALAQQPAAPSGEAVARDPYAPTDREVIQDFLSICREMKPVGRWPGEVVCGAIERMLNEPKGFRFIAKADMAPERGHNGRGGDADRPFSGPRRGTPQQPAAVTQPGAGGVSNGSGQPAAVDGAVVEVASLPALWMREADEIDRLGHVVNTNSIRARASELERALAAQAGGSDND